MATHWLQSLTISIPLLALAGAGEAATLIKFKDAQQEGPSEVLIGSGMARVTQGEQGDGYMIMNLKEKKQFLVSDQEKQVIEIGDMAQHMQSMPGMQPPASERPLELNLDKKGKGPDIAGYATDHYVVSVGGKVCFEEYLAKDPLKIPEVRQFADAMMDLNSGASGPMMDLCDRAEIELSRKYPDLGLPMRSLDGSGQLVSEIETLKTDVNVPAGALDIPADYERVSMQDMMRQMMQNMPQGMEMPPQ